MVIFPICLKEYVVCTYKNRLNEAILISTHNIHFQNKISNYPKILMTVVTENNSRDSRTNSKKPW